MVLAAANLLFVGLYFVGFRKTEGHPSNPGLSATARAATQMLSQVLNPVAERLWPISGLAILVLVVSSWALLVAIRHSEPAERARASGLFLFLGGMVALALGIGFGRAGFSDASGFAAQYEILPVPALCAAYLVWGLWGGKLGRLIQMGLFALTCVLFPFNAYEGLRHARTQRDSQDLLLRDMARGLPPFILAEYYMPDLWMNHDAVTRCLKDKADLLRMLHRAAIGPFRLMREDPAIRPVSLPTPPNTLSNLVWDGGTGQAVGSASFAEFTLAEPRLVYAIRLRLTYRDTPSPHQVKILWRNSRLRGYSENRAMSCSVSEPFPNSVTLWINDTVDQLRLHLDDKPCTFTICDMLLLMPKADAKQGLGAALAARAQCWPY
jgi:hypothetical protein